MNTERSEIKGNTIDMSKLSDNLKVDYKEVNYDE